ncbi:MAG: aminotransferase class I/II-fold pyridoxal phosphate-dependent enzyme [Deltaproteobacteria bacterium]|nr:aminotransferase class I/II-fold pyridoxal phosphate-dependent enzyme [Deltaproteobacteria bacterium]MBW1813270.1 aminotransferase class I/II-fold pyridoxal phosphate-dependent enzyme [Deltaproteobacteria bacterium]MBW1846270.1 aminotransferase class I/II-fold pyridoxal phosphate-dependent enzyme [Deltaproteobacteria bacterium]MBW1984384.1 aminotransferase class I/II-fold pyridoxal phosphate-dependent enzyme [Deltaproteobacteria bacterium]MBW2181238.1 aminotransferase class I/II-fold pyridox
MEKFARLDRLPPYVFATVDAMKMEARRKGEDIVDLGMGNPDLSTPKHIVDKMIEAVQKPQNHRYSASMGINKLRMAIASWYRRRFGVAIDPDSEAIVTIGVKEGISHLILVTIRPGDVVFTPNPTYPIHPFSAIIAGGEVRGIPMGPGVDFFDNLMHAIRQTWPRPKVLIINFPHNPTTEVVDLSFFEKIVDFAKENGLMVIHDFAYADLVFDGYKAPSFMQAKGAKDVGVEFFSLSKSYSMAGWRVGFCVGNKEVIAALRRIKSYLDYGIFQPIQISAIIALSGLDEKDDKENYCEQQECVKEIVDTYKSRRDALISGLERSGWNVPSPKGTMFVWAKIPDKFAKMGSVEFSKLLIKEAQVAVSPGLGFGEYGDDYVRFALIENNMRINQAVRGIRKVMQ